jgi:hypothetical protein
MTALLPYLTAVLRWALALLAGWLVRKGLLDADQSAQFVTILGGVAVAAVPLVWSFVQKHRTASHIQDAADAPVGAPVKGTPL